MGAPKPRTTAGQRTDVRAGIQHGFVLRNYSLAKERNKGGRPPRTPGTPRTGLIRARVLPQTQDVLTRAAGGSSGVPTLLDEIARIIGQLKEIDAKLEETSEST